MAAAASRPSKRHRGKDSRVVVSQSKVMRRMIPAYGMTYDIILAQCMMERIYGVDQYPLEELKEERSIGPGKVAIEDFERAERDGHIIRIKFHPETTMGSQGDRMVWKLFVSLQIDDAPTPLKELRPRSGMSYDLMTFDGEVEPSEAAKARSARIKEAIETSPRATSEYNSGFLDLVIALVQCTTDQTINIDRTGSLFEDIRMYISFEGRSLVAAQLIAAGFSPSWVLDSRYNVDTSDFAKLIKEYTSELSGLDAPGKLPKPSKFADWEKHMRCSTTDSFKDVGMSDAALAVRLGQEIAIRYVSHSELNDDKDDGPPIYGSPDHGEWVLCE